MKTHASCAPCGRGCWTDVPIVIPVLCEDCAGEMEVER
jgi:hypothetical protein